MGLLHRYDKQAGYNPVALLDTMVKELHLKNEAALARILQVDQSILSKVRHRRAPVTAGLLLRMHVRTKVPLGFLFKWMGVSAL